MGSMFANSFVFNQPLNAWNVSQVTSMKQMFWEAFKFNQSLNAWNVSRVTTMHEILQGAKEFNQPYQEWNWPLLRLIEPPVFYNLEDFIAANDAMLGEH